MNDQDKSDEDRDTLPSPPPVHSNYEPEPDYPDE